MKINAAARLKATQVKSASGSQRLNQITKNLKDGSLSLDDFYTLCVMAFDQNDRAEQRLLRFAAEHAGGPGETSANKFLRAYDKAADEYL